MNSIERINRAHNLSKSVICKQSTQNSQTLTPLIQTITNVNKASCLCRAVRVVLFVQNSGFINLVVTLYWCTIWLMRCYAILVTSRSNISRLLIYNNNLSVSKLGKFAVITIFYVISITHFSVFQSLHNLYLTYITECNKRALIIASCFFYLYSIISHVPCGTQHNLNNPNSTEAM